jgi:hypothetical protein
MIGAPLTGLPAGKADIPLFDARQDLLDVAFGVELLFGVGAEDKHADLLSG